MIIHVIPPYPNMNVILLYLLAGLTANNHFNHTIIGKWTFHEEKVEFQTDDVYYRVSLFEGEFSGVEQACNGKVAGS